MAFPTTSVLDAFTRADEAPATGWGSSGTAGNASGLKVVSNKAQPNAAANGYGAGYYTAATYGPDVEAYATLVSGWASGKDFWVDVRLKDVGGGSPQTTVDGYGVEVLWAAGADAIYFYRYDNGTAVQLGAAGAQDFANGDKLGVSMVGSTLSAYIYTGGAWTLIDTRTDATYAAAGYIGCGARDPLALDDFGGGTIVAGAGRLPPARALVGVGV